MPTVTPTNNANTFRLKVGSTYYETTIVPEEYGAMDSYIEQREGWYPACARCYLTQAQLNALTDPIRQGRTPVALVVGGNASVDDPLRVATISAGSATPIPTAEIFYVWKYWTIKAAVNQNLFEVEFRTFQQWWDAIPVSKAYNALNIIRTDYTTEEGATASFSNWQAIAADLVSSFAGITAVTFNNSPTVYSPLDFRLRNVPVSVALRRLCNAPRMVLQHDIYQNTFVMDQVTQPDSSTWDAYILNGDFETNQSQSELVPDTLLFVANKPQGGYSTSSQSRGGVGFAQGPSGSSMPFHIGDYFDHPTLPTGSASYTAVAGELGPRYYGNATVARQRYLLAGHVYPLVATSPAIYMHPGMRYRKVSLSCEGLTTLIETGPVDPYIEDVRYTHNGWPQTNRVIWRSDGGVDSQEPNPRFRGMLGGGALVPGQNLKWDYPFTKMKPAATVTATPRWVIDTVSPLTDASAGASPARNDNEDNNPVSVTAGGMTGTGISVSSSSPTCTMKPLGAGAVVDIMVSYLADGTAIFDFSDPNTFGP